MRIVIANCSVIYSGRGDTRLERANRAIMIKSDGAISIHNDKGNKPLNYMGKGNILTETYDINNELVWTFDTRKESLQITMHDVISDTGFEIADDCELIRDGTESQLQAWIAEHPESLGEGYTTVKREYPTGAGPVDILVLDGQGNPVAVEVKRVAMLGAVDQASRYVEALRGGEFPEATSMVAALDIRPNTIKLADKREIPYVVIPASWRDN